MKNFEITAKQIILESKQYEEQISFMVNKLHKEVEEANSEATISQRIEDKLKELLKYFAVDYAPTKEEQVRIFQGDAVIIQFRKNVQNRIDSRFCNIITEYKKDIRKDYEANCDQLVKYMVNTAANEQECIDKYYGILTDGKRITFIHYKDGIKILSNIQELNTRMMKEVIRIYISLGGKEFSAPQLVKDFSIDNTSSVSLSLAKYFYEKLIEKDEIIVAEWENLFRLGGHNDNNMSSIKSRKKVLSQYFSIDENCVDETKALFALQTVYSIILKLIAYNVVAEIHFKNNAFKIDYNEIKQIESDALKRRIRDIDTGDVFTQLGFSNLLESDFFSWYLEDDIWDSGMANLLKELMGILSEYDVGQRLFENKNNASDFFRELYQSIIPREVRHSLGEYYTEAWLAEHVILGKKDYLSQHEKWRGMDPCCGSGTFIMKMIERILLENDSTDKNMLPEILSRVSGHDLNPLAVLTCRINYFLVISRFLDPSKIEDITIPIRIGDSALAPQIIVENDVEIVVYEIVDKEETSIFKLPKNVLSHRNFEKKKKIFINKMQTGQCDEEFYTLFHNLCSDVQELEVVCEFVLQCVELKKKGHSIHWIKSIIDILSTRISGRVDFIVSNPPWIDWKALPDGYRDTLKLASIDNHVFSGDRFTGGINLNICALITNVVANTWLCNGGVMGILMPKSLLFQPTYRGFRKLTQIEGEELHFDSLVDWSEGGNPFPDVTEKFMTYYFVKKDNCEKEGIPVYFMKKMRGTNLFDRKYTSFSELKHKYSCEEKVAYKVSEDNNSLTIISQEEIGDVEKLKNLVGKCMYQGRVGLGLYPKEAQLLEIDHTMKIDRPDLVWMKNYKNPRSERKVEKGPSLLERNMLCPVIEGPNIKKFRIEGVHLYAAFPYTEEDTKKPIPKEKLSVLAPYLCQYYDKIKDDIKKTEYNQRIQGKKGEFYSLTRVGKYTFCKNKVVFRNNTKWNAAVISEDDPVYENYSMYLLLDHACSISQTREGRAITADEAHYICAILNSAIVEKYIVSSSDARSFKSDIPIHIEEYDSGNATHKELVRISKEAHEKGITEDLQSKLDKIVSEMY